ncbi:unnamed protein product [Pedinophyceae sp. YPF-701]|nr:unnamed protein product [Pedinophyceae sp. YPF-701]
MCIKSAVALNAACAAAGTRPAPRSVGTRALLLGRRLPEPSSCGGRALRADGPRFRRAAVATRASGDGPAGASPAEVDAATGLPIRRTKVCIIGGGPSGHTAAIYAARANLNPVMLEGFMAEDVPPGGQLTMTTLVENFPGFPEGVMGPDLMAMCRAQSVRVGVEIFTETANPVDFSCHPFRCQTDSQVILADAVIISTGAHARRLHFPGADDMWMRGISACAVCDGPNPVYRNQPLAVIGGGDTALEYALLLAKYGASVDVFVQLPKLNASAAMVGKAQREPKIRFHFNAEVVEALPDDAGDLRALRVRDGDGEREMPCIGLWFAIGHEPATDFVRGQLELDRLGYIVTPPGSTATSVPGVFAAGDVQDRRWRQAITAAGTGCMAALEAQHLLEHVEYLRAHNDEEHHPQAGTLTLDDMYLEARKGLEAFDPLVEQGLE